MKLVSYMCLRNTIINNYLKIIHLDSSSNKAHDFNNDLTVRLLRFADNKGYQFQSFHNDGIFCDDLPTGAKQLPAFKQIRDKVRSFYQRLKSKDSSSSIPNGSDPVPADGTRKMGKRIMFLQGPIAHHQKRKRIISSEIMMIPWIRKYQK